MSAGEGLLNLTMQIPMGMEWLLIVVVIVVVFFGVRKIPELARSFGKATTEFEKAKIEAKKELQQLKSQENVGREKLEAIADSLGIDYTNKNDDELRAAIEVELNKSKQ
jgi:sec-independent protein translocase protein TatA